MKPSVILLVGACLMTVLPAAMAVGVGLEPGDIGTQAVSYVHNDRVGPGLPGTAPTHSTHTTNVPGFVKDPAKPVMTSIIPLSLFGAGICPTAVSGPVLPQDFTGHYEVLAVCRDAANDGTVFVNAIFDYVGGFPFSFGGGGSDCELLTDATSFSLDITVTIADTTFLGVTLPPLGGIRVAVSQA